MLSSPSCSPTGSQVSIILLFSGCGVKLSLTSQSPVSTSSLSRCPRGTATFPCLHPATASTSLPEIHPPHLSSCFHPVFLQPCFQHNTHCSVIPSTTLSYQIQILPPGIKALAAISAPPISSLVTPPPPAIFPISDLAYTCPSIGCPHPLSPAHPYPSFLSNHCPKRFSSRNFKLTQGTPSPPIPPHALCSRTRPLT